MTPLRLAWALCLWGIVLILNHMVGVLGKAQVDQQVVESRITESANLAQQGFRSGLDWLRANPQWEGSLPEFGSNGLTCTLSASNFGQSPTAGYAYETTWVPPYSMALKAQVKSTDPPESDLVYVTTVSPRPPIFWSGAARDEQGPFRCPLPTAPDSASGKLSANAPLRPGAYHDITVAGGVSALLEPDLAGARVYRFRRLVLLPGARLVIRPIKACPAIVYIDELLDLQGQNVANWEGDATSGPAAFLQFYGGPRATLRVRDTQLLSATMAGPRVSLSRSKIHGAVSAPDLNLEASEVLYEEGLRGAPLQGLGPLTLSPQVASTGTLPQVEKKP